MKIVTLLSLALLVSLAMATTTRADDKATKVRLYIGSYAQEKGQGISVAELNLNTGELSEPRLAAEAINPSFLAIHPSKQYLYAVSETVEYKGKKAGSVLAYAIQDDGGLKLLNEQSSRGGAPCHLVVDRKGKNVLVANYVGGNVVSLPIADDGSLKPDSAFIQHEGSSVNKQRQEAPHAHSINLDAKNRYAFVADLGLDQVLVYRFKSNKGKLTANDPAGVKVTAGAGPRHFAFHTSGKYAYVINELHLTVTAFSYDAKKGELKEIQTITTLPKHDLDRNGMSTAEVQVHPSGKFLYGSNRGHNTIAMFTIDQDTGKLTAIGHEETGGKTPRNFAIDPTGNFLLAENQSSNDIFVFRIDQKTGRLQKTSHSVQTNRPVCIKFMPMD